MICKATPKYLLNVQQAKVCNCLMTLNNIKIIHCSGQPRWRSGLALPAARGVILETLDRVPHRASCMEPASPSACVSASLALSE